MSNHEPNRVKLSPLTFRLFFVTYLSGGGGGGCFYNKGPMMLYFVPMYRPWSFLSISTKINTKKIHVTSLWRHIRKNGKKRGKITKFVFVHKLLGASDFHRDCGSFYKKPFIYPFFNDCTWDEYSCYIRLRTTQPPVILRYNERKGWCEGITKMFHKNVVILL